MSRSVHGGWSPTIPLVQESPVDAVIAREMLARFAETLQSHGIAWCRAWRPRTQDRRGGSRRRAVERRLLAWPGASRSASEAQAGSFAQDGADRTEWVEE